MESPASAGIRINKYLSDAGICSRREADRMIRAGDISVNGKTARAGMKVTEKDRILVKGREIRREDEKVLLLFYKPPGIVCSTRKQGQDMTVTEFLDYPVRIYPVGRLDKDSEGLLLMTNIGELSDRILRARNAHEKEYEVTVDREFDDEFLKKMGNGVPILDTVTRKCRVWRTGKKRFRIILTQGLNRQIRRMCEYLGFRVVSLRRDRILNLTLEGLSPGEYRPVREEELNVLLEMLGKGVCKLNG